MKILITGATGALGGKVIETLLTQLSPDHIATLTRKEEKQKELRDKGFNSFLGSYDDVASLEKAMKDVDAVLLISAGDQGDRMQEHKNVVDAANKMGVKNIAYTSRSLKDRSSLANDLMKEHFLTEDHIMQSGLAYTFFRNSLYMDVIPIFVGKERVFESGIFMPAGDGKVAYALREEQGEAMANVLMNHGFDNLTYQFTGDEAYSFYDVAKALTELSGKEVNYTAVDVAKFGEIMKQKGTPEPVIKKIVDFNMDIKNGQEAETTGELEKHLGRKPTPLKAGLKQLFNL